MRGDNMKKALIAMSGGVDSSVSALLIKNLGYHIEGVTLTLSGFEGVEDARKVSDLMGAPFHVVDLQELFNEKVVKSFVESYLRGETPNPCIECNKFVKFGALFDYAQENGFDKLVTGHYARVQFDETNNRYMLRKAVNHSKDQSYVLYNLSQDKLSKLLLPIGEFSKDEVRKIANESGFVNSDKPDSQDICFIQDGDYAWFIESYIKRKVPSGDFVDANGNFIAKHKGIIHYTIGQRKGLGISSTEPYYVIKKDVESNSVILGRENEQYVKRFIAKDVNFILFDKLTGDMKIKAKIRYKHKETPATISPIDENTVAVTFDEPQKAVTSGQSVVFYDGEYVVGGGKIV